MIKECAGIECGVLWAGKTSGVAESIQDDSPYGVSMVVSLPNWLGGAAVCVRVLCSRRFRAGTAGPSPCSWR